MGRRSYCYSCDQENSAKFDDDLEFHCMQCNGTCIELLTDENVARLDGNTLSEAGDDLGNSAVAPEAPVSMPVEGSTSAPGPADTRLPSTDMLLRAVQMVEASRGARTSRTRHVGGPGDPRRPPSRVRQLMEVARSRAGGSHETGDRPSRHNPRLSRRARHSGVVCDGCQSRDFVGARYRCLTCADFDLCEACYARRDTIHPDHAFEAIPMPRAIMQTIIVVDFQIGEENEAQSGLNEEQVAWWLADENRLADVSVVADQDPPWTCAICSEGLEAEHCNGWVVRICNEHCEKRTSASEDGPKELEGHIYHETCLRKWLVRKNACPVCRRTPVVPEVHQ